MKTNVGTWDRVARGGVAIIMLIGAIAVPLPTAARIALLGLPALYVAFTALVGTCLGYRLMGRSTCPVSAGERDR